MNDLTKAGTILFIMWAFPHCSEKINPHVRSVDASIALAVQEDMLRSIVERRLQELEQHPATTSPRIIEKIQPVSASEAIHY